MVRSGLASNYSFCVAYGHECFPILGRKHRHLVGNRVELLLEEDGELAGNDVAQQDGGHVKTSEISIDWQARID